MELNYYIERTQSLKAKKDVLGSEMESISSEIEALQHQSNDTTKAQNIFQIVAENTQKNIQIKITSLVNMALETIHPNPPKFIMNYITKWNNSSCDLLFEENGKTYKPLDGGGYGLVNIVSFALRIAIWSLKKTNPIIICDEPFQNLSQDLHSKASEMLKSLSIKTGIQFIIVSHSESINDSADKVFLTTKKDGITKLKEI